MSDLPVDVSFAALDLDSSSGPSIALEEGEEPQNQQQAFQEPHGVNEGHAEIEDPPPPQDARHSRAPLAPPSAFFTPCGGDTNKSRTKLLDVSISFTSTPTTTTTFESHVFALEPLLAFLRADVRSFVRDDSALAAVSSELDSLHNSLRPSELVAQCVSIFRTSQVSCSLWHAVDAFARLAVEGDVLAGAKLLPIATSAATLFAIASSIDLCATPIRIFEIVNNEPASTTMQRIVRAHLALPCASLLGHLLIALGNVVSDDHANNPDGLNSYNPHAKHLVGLLWSACSSVAGARLLEPEEGEAVVSRSSARDPDGFL